MKSIKELADELGVSKQAVFKKIKRPPLSTNLQGLTSTVHGRLMVSVDGESLIKQAFIDNDRQPVVSTVDGLVDDVVDESSTTNDAILTVLRVTIDALQEQIKIKDAQILSLTDELAKEREHSRTQADELLVLVDQAQQLHAKSLLPLALESKKPGLFSRLFHEKSPSKK